MNVSIYIFYNIYLLKINSKKKALNFYSIFIPPNKVDFLLWYQEQNINEVNLHCMLKEKSYRVHRCLPSKSLWISVRKLAVVIIAKYGYLLHYKNSFRD